MVKTIFVVVLVICSLLQRGVTGYKILGVFPSTSRSHYIVGSALLKGLAAKGHEVTAITAYPLNENIHNYEEIPIPEVLQYFTELYETLQQAGDKLYVQIFVEMLMSGRMLSERVLEQPIIQEFLKSPNRSYDLVICEIFVTDALFGFGQHFNAPVIGISPMANSLWAAVLSGSPTPASFLPNVFLGNTDRMNFLARTFNLAALTAQYLGYHLDWLPYQAKVYNKFFPNASLTLPEVLRNVSLILLNQHVSIGNSEPLMHSVVEVGGLHIQRQTNPLPHKIREFLNNATHGAILFSLGTNLESQSLRKEKLEAILNTFRSLKQRVLWKYENSSLLGKSDNILISDWFPQNDILAHPNVKLFITHGGLLGTTEAIYHAKPLLGIPLFCDQFINMARTVDKGFALKVPYTQINEERLKTTIGELLNNPNYSQKAKQVSVHYRDQPMEPLETAIFWVEYVLRHKGAPHLRSVALDLNFIQYHSIDTIAVLYGGILLIVYFSVRLLKGFISNILGFERDSKHKTE